MHLAMSSARSRYVAVGALVLTLVVAAAAFFNAQRPPAGAQTPEPDKNEIVCLTVEPCRNQKPDDEPNSDSDPAVVEGKKKLQGWGNEQSLAAPPVHQCPLSSAGCAAAEELLNLIDRGETRAVLESLKPTFPIGRKSGMQIVDERAFTDALTVARGRLGTIAIGCPQMNVLGPEAGACEDLFVLAVSVDLRDGGTTKASALGFEFVRLGDRFALQRAELEPAVQLDRGGGSLTYVLPAEFRERGLSALWYTPWPQ